MAHPSSLLSCLLLGLWIVPAGAEDENSLQRLESAKQGIAEGSWPRKPDDRLSPLSGKMKEISEISPKYYGSAKEFPSPKPEKWKKEASWGSRTAWEESADRDWEAARWGGVGHGEKNWNKDHEKFQPDSNVESTPILNLPEVQKKPAQDWSSRSSLLGGRDGSLRMYEGRLTRIRKYVWQESEDARDLGRGKREQFTPQEVQMMLSQPVGEFRGLPKEQSGGASLPALGGN